MGETNSKSPRIILPEIMWWSLDDFLNRFASNDQTSDFKVTCPYNDFSVKTFCRREFLVKWTWVFLPIAGLAFFISCLCSVCCCTAIFALVMKFIYIWRPNDENEAQNAMPNERVRNIRRIYRPYRQRAGIQN